jgi:hypothetical protein
MNGITTNINTSKEKNMNIHNPPHFIFIDNKFININHITYFSPFPKYDYSSLSEDHLLENYPSYKDFCFLSLDTKKYYFITAYINIHILNEQPIQIKYSIPNTFIDHNDTHISKITQVPIIPIFSSNEKTKQEIYNNLNYTNTKYQTILLPIIQHINPSFNYSSVLE